LSGDRGQVPLTEDGIILWTGACLDAAWASVVADSIHDPDVNSFVVDIANIDDVYARDRAIVEEPVALPSSAGIANAEITEAVNDSAVKTDLRSPITLMEKIDAVVPSPIGRSPEVTGLGSQDPRAGHPVVVVVIVVPCPISWSPNVAFSGAQRLLVDG